MRALNRIVALVLGLAAATGAVILGTEVVLLASEREEWVVPRSEWRQNLRSLQWDDSTLTLVLGIALVAGLALFIAQLVSRRSPRLHVRSDDPGRRVSITRRGLEGQLARLADRDPEVLSPAVKLTRRKALLSAAFPTRTEGQEIGLRLRTLADDRLEHAQLERPLRVQVRLRPARQRVR